MTDVTDQHRSLHRHRILQVVARSSAHDLRNVAQLLQMSADVSRGEPDADVPIPELLDTTSLRVLNLAGRLATWSSTAPRRAEPAVLAQIVAPLGDLLHNHPARDRLTLDMGISPNLPVIEVVPEEVLEALWELVTNAMHAGGGERITVTVTAEQRDRQIELVVTDSGPGVPADVVPSLFMVHESKTGAPARIGLAVARALLHKQGGDLDYRVTGSGAEFVATIPIWQARPLSS